MPWLVSGQAPRSSSSRQGLYVTLQGDEVHELLLEHTGLRNIKTIYEPDYRLDLFEDPA
jgi:hypothetical protein